MLLKTANVRQTYRSLRSSSYRLTEASRCQMALSLSFALFRGQVLLKSEHQPQEHNRQQMVDDRACVIKRSFLLRVKSKHVTPAPSMKACKAINRAGAFFQQRSILPKTTTTCPPSRQQHQLTGLKPFRYPSIKNSKCSSF